LLSESPIPNLESQLSRLRHTWGTLGADDPLWAILSRPDMRGGRWDADAFFAAGETEIGAIEGHLAEFGLPRERRLALDFGCGVGRLTRALAARYAQVIGVDIAPSMLAQAQRLLATCDNVRFVENAAARLEFAADASVDLVYSVITLHHNPPALQRAYIDEFLRVLAPGGVAVFQIATGFSRDWRGFVYRTLPNRWLAPLRRRLHRSSVAAELHVLNARHVHDIAAARGRRVLAAFDSDSAGAGFRAQLFFVG
jgi:SAM-dependent methyltransferase